MPAHDPNNASAKSASQDTSFTGLPGTQAFADRHIGPREHEVSAMLGVLGLDSLDALVDAAVPSVIRGVQGFALDAPLDEAATIARLRDIADKNKNLRSYIGMGYHGCVIPGVIQRNILENPGWYTQYTPYQAEIAQGRLEALLNFQTMITDLTGLPVANASLLDEGTAAAEAMVMCRAILRGKRRVFFVDDDVHPQTYEVVRTRAEAVGIDVIQGSAEAFDFAAHDLFGVLLQYPGTDGVVRDLGAVADKVHAAGAQVVVAADLLALTLLRAPGELGADMAIGSAQRFGVPMGFGGPHAAFLATTEKHKRLMPGRVVGVSQDATEKPALRLAMQTREQHIRREKATSNICTAQVLLAIMSGMYAVYHGAEGLKRIAKRVHGMACLLADGARQSGVSVVHSLFFDTIRLQLSDADADSLMAGAVAAGFNLRRLNAGNVCIALDETASVEDVEALLGCLGAVVGGESSDVTALVDTVDLSFPALHARTSPFLEQGVFKRYHSETELLRYIRRLEQKDISLNRSMIPLGSCTMKLNAVAEMQAITWPEFAELHPFVPPDQARGYAELLSELEQDLARITGFAAVSLQPNAGSQGELAGLLVIRAHHHERGDQHRDICLIPSSAHGTNPASAVMAGMRVVVIACDDDGNIDLADLRAKTEEHGDKLSALMVTYPSTHGVFEETIRDICDSVHAVGGQVYMDGANLNAQVGLAQPGTIGADVCHLNLHKTFAIPHGGGGPGVGPIAVAEHLRPYLPGHSVVATGGDKAIGAVSAAPWGSASIMPISWAYIKMLGAEGLKRSTQIAILNANYMAKRLEPHYPVVYRGVGGWVAHEFIMDLRGLKAEADVTVDDVAKRLMDFGFHAPTMSWPVAGTMMVEPTESESKVELDRFCDAMIQIRKEVTAIAKGDSDRENNVLKHAPHTPEVLLSADWDRPYSRDEAAYALPWVRDDKYWPPVGRIDNAWGDRNFVCTCAPLEAYSS